MDYQNRLYEKLNSADLGMKQNYYTVYNVIERSSVDGHPQTENNVFNLYKLLLGSDAVVNIEQHNSEDGLRSELRVIFWSKEEYAKWAANNRIKYDELILNFSNAHAAAGIKFSRYTSNDEYCSEFPYTHYPPRNQLISWTLIPYHLDWVVNNIIPIGHMIDYNGNGVWNKSDDPDATGCRFLKERTSSIVRRPHNLSTYKGKIPTQLLMYTFDHAMQIAMHQHPYIYKKFMQLNKDVEDLAETYIDDCDHAAVLMGHKSLDESLLIHTHRVTEQNRLSLTIIVRLTFNDSGIDYRFWNPIPDDDPNLPNYYSDPALLKRSYTDHQQPNEFKIAARSSILVFSGSHVPHSVTFDNDLYLFYVWDNVNFKPGMLEKIKESSQRTYFNDQQDEAKKLYYFNLPDVYNMKTALITGGTKGIGLAIANALSKDYHVVTVGRSDTATEQGDLQDEDFRNYLVEKYTPDLFVNNAAALFSDKYKTLHMNGTASVDLLLKFYDKMSYGQIINVSSISAERLTGVKENDIRTAYAVAKKYLKETSIALSNSKSKPVKVMCISPSAVDTPLARSLTDFRTNPDDYKNYNWNSSICWAKPEEIASIVRWMIDQPEWISIPEIVVDNHYSNSSIW